MLRVELGLETQPSPAPYPCKAAPKGLLWGSSLSLPVYKGLKSLRATSFVCVFQARRPWQWGGGQGLEVCCGYRTDSREMEEAAVVVPAQGCYALFRIRPKGAKLAEQIALGRQW